MMKDDNVEASKVVSEYYEDHRLSNFWDSENELGKLYSKILQIYGPAWDIYLFYPPGILWTGDNPPQPTFWMHQLPEDLGTDVNQLLNAGMFANETLKLLCQESKISWGNLAFLMHVKALLWLKRGKNSHSVEEIAEALRNTKQ